MKIKKEKKLVESKLVEADEPVDTLSPNASEEEVKKTLEDNTDLKGNEAEAEAEHLKKTAEEAGAIMAITDEDFKHTIVKSKLFGILDEHLAKAKEYCKKAARGVKMTGNLNILVEGLPGAGKTAIVKSWAASHDLVVVAVSSTDRKLETAINGMPLRDQLKVDKNAVTYVYSDKLDYLMYEDFEGNPVHPECEGRCILFVDEFNRQTDQSLRRPLMTLFNEKMNADGHSDFRRNLLFTIICNNPSGKKYKDPGTKEMNDAEKDRFFTQLLGYNSEIDEAKSFWDGWIQESLLHYGVIPPNSWASDQRNGYFGPVNKLSKEDRKDVEEIIKTYELANYILMEATKRGDEIFTSDADLDDLHLKENRLLSARSFQDLILWSEGDIKVLFKQLERMNVMEKVKTVLHKILDHKVFDWKQIWKDYGLDDNQFFNKGAKGAEEAPKAAEPEDNDEVEDDDLFDDDDVAASGNKTGGSTTSSDADVINVIQGWNFQ